MSVSPTFHVSITEAPAFRRLARFLEEVEALASVNADEELQGLVDECRGDLLLAADEDRTGD